jgi:hypothetical protein
VEIDIQLVRIAAAGLLGALSMALAAYVFNLLGIPMPDLGRFIATKLLGYHSHRTRLGFVLHCINGVVLALIYAVLIVPILPGPYVIRGLIYGVALWLVMMVVLLPLLGDGLFGTRTSGGMAPAALVLHVLYGIVLGIVVRE